MTVADQPSSRIARRTRAASCFPSPAVPAPAAASHVPDIDPPQFPVPQPSGKSWLSLFSVRTPLSPPPSTNPVRFAEADPKPDADVVDLLIMNTLDHPAGTAPTAPSSSPPTAREGADLLDSLVADHLERATHPAEIEPPVDDAQAMTGEVPWEEPVPATGGGAEDGADLLQREIEALLAGTPSAAAPVEAARSETMEEHIPEAPLNQAELDVLLAGKVDESEHSAEGPSMMEAPTAVLPEEDEAASKMLEAEGVLAEELAQLMAETAAPPPVMTEPVAVVEAMPEPAAMQATASVDGSTEEAAAPAAERPPGVPEHPIVELAGEVEGDFETEAEVEKAGRRWTGIFSDVGLVAAQIADMPFRWIDVMDKNLLGVAAAVLLLSGLVLKLVAMWMGV